MIRRRFLCVLVAVFAAVLCLPAVARAGVVEVPVSGYSVSSYSGVYICSYAPSGEESNDMWFNQTYGMGELTNPGVERQRFLNPEYNVPLEIVGGDEAFAHGLADNWNWSAPDVAENDGVYIASSDLFGGVTGDVTYNMVLIGMVPISQQPVEKAVITVNETNSEGQVTDFSIDLVYSTGPAGTNIPVSGDAGVAMQMMPSAWVARYITEGKLTPKATASSLSADDAACKELVDSVEDGQIVGVYDLLFAPDVEGHTNEYSEGYGTMWVTFTVDEKYNGDHVDVWTWHETDATEDPTEGEVVLRGTYPITDGEVTVPLHRLTQVALSVQVDGSSYAMERLYNPYTGEHLYTPPRQNATSSPPLVGPTRTRPGRRRPSLTPRSGVSSTPTPTTTTTPRARMSTTSSSPLAGPERARAGTPPARTASRSTASTTPSHPRLPTTTRQAPRSATAS